jgi:hypothetical protein
VPNRLVWDKVGERNYETGLDKGVLYLPDGSAVVWNGLTSIVEHFNKETSPVYFDGMKINELVTLGDFSATMKAVTYPDEFSELEGLGQTKHGLFYGDQPPKAFGLCYRTQIGNDLEGENVGYKIHILYNVFAMPSDKTYATASSDPSLVEFEWEINAVPEEVDGFRPTAHIIINTKEIDPILLTELESILYGTTLADASLIPMAELVDIIAAFFRVEITDNGDGTWEAYSEIPGLVEFTSLDAFEIVGVNAWYLDDFTYEVESTTSKAEVPLIKVYGVGDGTWTAHSEEDSLIVENESEHLATIYDATIDQVDDVTFQIYDTP